MTRATMFQCLEALKDPQIKTVDLTGGATEMNPDFKWFVQELFKLNKEIIVRSNLTFITSNEKNKSLPQFFKDHKLVVISSLPCYTKDNTDAQMGEGVFNKSMEALKLLNDIGYGVAGSDLQLHLVYNPIGIKERFRNFVQRPLYHHKYADKQVFKLFVGKQKVRRLYAETYRSF